MRPTYVARSRFFSIKNIVIGIAVLLVGAGGTIAALFAAGILKLPQPSRAGPPAGKVAVPLTVRAIKAYATVTREDFFDVKTNEPKVIYLSPEEVESRGFITNINKVLGRVVARDKSAGYAFTDKELMPAGTRAGLVAGIPAGKRAMALDMSKIQGVVYLKAGDHFDLMAAYPINAAKGSPLAKSLEAQTMHGTKRVGVKVIVHDGVVITPVTPPKKAGKKIGDRPAPEHEIVIAVDPEEVAPLTEALALKADLLCIARSGRPDDPGSASVVPGSAPLPKFAVTEVLIGSRRQSFFGPIVEDADKP